MRIGRYRVTLTWTANHGSMFPNLATLLGTIWLLFASAQRLWAIGDRMMAAIAAGMVVLFYLDWIIDARRHN